MKRHAEPLKYIIWGSLIIGFGILVSFLIIQAITLFPYHFKKEIPNPQEFQPIISVAGVEDTYTGTYFLVHPDVSVPHVSAESFLIADLDTGHIILDKSSSDVFPIASVTKLMTAVITREQLPLESITMISQTAIATESFRGNLSVGQHVPIDELIYPLLLTSSNDAAEALAEAENRDNFLKRMNRQAQALGMWDTNYDDPSGLSSLNQSSAHDLFILVRYIYQQHPQLLKITRSPYYIGEKQTWKNISNLLSESTFYGGKTGYTDVARQTSAGVYNITFQGGLTRPVIIVILKSNSRESDIHRLISFVQNNIGYQE